jgi:hypothetical protein
MCKGMKRCKRCPWRMGTFDAVTSSHGIGFGRRSLSLSSPEGEEVEEKEMLR